MQMSGGRWSSEGGLGLPPRVPDWDTGPGWSEDADCCSCCSCSYQGNYGSIKEKKDI